MYARFGLAVYLTQCIERSLAILVVTKYGPGPGRMTQSDYDAKLDALFRKTFGVLVATFRKHVSQPPSFDVKLDEAVNRRNWLAHRYFWERAGHFMSPEGREVMLSELQDLIDSLGQLNQEIETEGRRWWSESGLDPKVIDYEADKLIRESRL